MYKITLIQRFYSYFYNFCFTRISELSFRKSPGPLVGAPLLLLLILATERLSLLTVRG
jgi:hypothetical protein